MTDSIVIITGLSGSGKSAAARAFEDMGFYCVDNLPVALIPVFSDLCSHAGEVLSRVALVIDIREGHFLDDFPGVVARMRGERSVEVVFFEASDEILARRFNETRRPHPMGSGGRDLMESIRRERQALKAIRRLAGNIVDTSAFTVHDLKSYLLDRFLTDERESTLLVPITSFGFKYGAPSNLDILFDVRFITNPYFVDDLKLLTGKDDAVREFLAGKPEYVEFLEKTTDLLRFLLPLYVKEGKSYLRIGVGCTGGRHRSVAAADSLAATLKDAGTRIRVQHRDVERE
ncbi:MAG: RNase adapter RapZ [Acidobacteriota bacterium]